VLGFMNSLSLLKDQEEDLRKRFRHLDKDNDGYLTFQEIEKAIEPLQIDSKAKNSLKDNLTLADHDGDGRISYAEF